MIFNVNSGAGKLPINVVPSPSGSLVYSGSAQSPAWLNYDSKQLSISGTTAATDAGTYTAYFTPKSNYKWSDGTTTARAVTWTIDRAVISTVPSQNGTLTYTGGAKTPAWSNYNSGQLAIGGTTSGTNAGSYTATFTPKANYKWSDGTTAAKPVTWTIGKAAGSMSLSSTSGTIRCIGGTATFTVNRSGDGAISAVSSDTSVATVSVSGNTVTVKAVKAGAANITVSVAAGRNHTAAGSKTYSVTTQSYLYYPGDECSDITGGWTGLGKAWNDRYYAYTPALTKGEDNIVATIYDSYIGCGFLTTENDIDLTGISTLTIECAAYTTVSDGNSNTSFCVFDRNAAYGNACRKAYKDCGANSFSKKTVTLDVSGLSGKYAVGLYMTNGGTGRNQNVTMYSLKSS